MAQLAAVVRGEAGGDNDAPPAINGRKSSSPAMSNANVVIASKRSSAVMPGSRRMEQSRLTDRAMRDLHALGLAGRAGGVNQVGQGLGGRRRGWVAVAFLTDRGAVAIE